VPLLQLQRSVYLAIVKISDARRNQIPLDLWAQRPPGKPKRRRHRPWPDVNAKRKEFLHDLIEQLGKPL